MPGVSDKSIGTVLETINRWVPSNENDIQAYVHAITTHIDVHFTALINIKNPAMQRWMVLGIIVHKNG
ncbi:hypothetical protein ACI2KE_17910 [Pseudomonas monteilii]